MIKSFVELIQVAIGTRKELSKSPSEGEWQQVYETAVKQSLEGVALCGIEELKNHCLNLNIPRLLLLQWIGEVQAIEKENKKLDEAAEHLTRIFKNGRLRSCVLKGQGVARLYNLDPDLNLSDNSSLGLRRQPGDIDIWVEGGRERVLQFLKSSQLRTGTVVIHHVDASIIDDVETEVHFLPSYTYNYLRYIKYKKFFKEEANQQFDHFDEQVGFAYPTNRFNAVYLMMHIFRHIFHEGIGLRQFLDYYFVLTHLTDEERQWAYGKLKWLGLGKVTAAVMYVMKAVFRMDERYMLCEPVEEMGRFLLEEIFRGGNFGKYDTQYESAHSGSSFNLYLKNLKRLGKVYSLCPSEVLWAPIWKPSHWMWRKWKGYV